MGNPAAKRFPAILGSQEVFHSPWVRLNEKLVQFASDSAPQKYYTLGLPDYTVVVPETEDGRLVIVRQYRPTVDRLTWEFPAGLVERGEPALDCARRELAEETGFIAEGLCTLGSHDVDTGRLENRIHNFHAYVSTARRKESQEAGIKVRLVSPETLSEMIARDEFSLQSHIAAFYLARHCRASHDNHPLP